jgi:hypothetical protein
MIVSCPKGRMSMGLWAKLFESLQTAVNPKTLRVTKYKILVERVCLRCGADVDARRLVEDNIEGKEGPVIDICSGKLLLCDVCWPEWISSMHRATKIIGENYNSGRAVQRNIQQCGYCTKIFTESGGLEKFKSGEDASFCLTYYWKPPNPDGWFVNDFGNVPRPSMHQVLPVHFV